MPNERKTRICIDCNSEFKLERPLRSYSNDTKKRCLACREARLVRGNTVSSKTKIDLFDERGNFQSARGAIAKDARRSFDKSGRPKECHVCRYDQHVQVCHIVAVSEFGSQAKVSEINDPSNLVALCPNHHWEFDHGLIEADKLRGQELHLVAAGHEPWPETALPRT